MNPKLRQFNGDEGVSTIETIALTAIILILLAIVYISIWNRSDQIDNALNNASNSQIQQWRSGS